MPIKLPKLKAGIPVVAVFRQKVAGGFSKDPRVVVRTALGALLALNLIATYFVFRPLGGSPEELEQQGQDLRKQILQKQAGLVRLKMLNSKSTAARQEGDAFLANYFMDRRNASLLVVSTLNKVAKEAGIRPKEHTFTFDPIEGSDTLSMMTITGNYEGTYADLMRHLYRLDRSPRFVILDSLTAAPQQSGGVLNIQMKMYAFVKEGGAPEDAPALLKQISNDQTSDAAPASQTIQPVAPPAFRNPTMAAANPAAAPPIATAPAAPGPARPNSFRQSFGLPQDGMSMPAPGTTPRDAVLDRGFRRRGTQ